MPNIVDEKGNPINLTDRQKNALYSQAKELKQKISDGLCSRDECRIPNDKNVHKMINSEFKNSEKVETFRKAMKAIGADPKDYNIERWRR